MEIIDENGKRREISSMKIISHPVSDGNGGVTNVEFVEYTVHGKVREWVDWCPLNVFRTNNPGVEIAKT